MRRHGLGLTICQQSLLLGSWKNGRLDGNVSFLLIDGYSFKGLFQNGQAFYGISTSADGTRSARFMMKCSFIDHSLIFVYLYTCLIQSLLFIFNEKSRYEGRFKDGVPMNENEYGTQMDFA